MQFYLIRRRNTRSELSREENTYNAGSTNKASKSDNNQPRGSRFTAGSKKKYKATRNNVNNVSASSIPQKSQNTRDDVPPEIRRFKEACDGNKGASVILTKDFLKDLYYNSPDVFTGRDASEILGVNCSDSDSRIRQRFRKLSLLFHLDKNIHPEAGEIFVRIRSAYERICNSRKK